MKVVIGCLLAICIIVGGIYLGTSASLGQTQQASNVKYPKGNTIGNMPFFDFTQSERMPDTEERSLRNIHFDKSSERKIVEDSRIKEITQAESWVESLPAIPVGKSDVIISCSVTNAEAYLSQNKSGVYSEFQVKITEILYSSDSARALNAEQVITVNREGGSVRFPSGHVQTYRLSGTGALEKNGSYIVFLRIADSLKGYMLLTAYKYENEKVYPIDNLLNAESYHGKSYSEFVKEINLAVSSRILKGDAKR